MNRPGYVRRFSGWFLAFACAVLLAGCGDTDCFVVSKDAKGIQKDAPVVWQDAYVGKVSAVEPLAEGAKVSLGINGDFAKSLHAGVAAQIVLDGKIGAAPFVLLVGGKDPAMPVLADGAQIPEVTPVAKTTGGGFTDWLKESNHFGEKAGGGLVVFLLLALRFVKKLVKLLIKLLILVVVVLTILIARQDWSAYRERFQSAASSFQSAQSWISDHSDSLKKLVEQAVPANPDAAQAKPQ